jgi:hypothetical protein
MEGNKKEKEKKKINRMVSDCDWSLLYVASCNGVFAAAAAVVAADGSIRHHLVVFTQLLKTAVLRHCIRLVDG